METCCLKCCCGLTIGLILLVLSSTTRADWAAHKGPNKKEYRSPDHALIATVIYLKPRSYGDTESRVEIRTSNGQRIAQADYHSSYGNQGYTVEEAGWTADSRFFVYITQSAGWHHPWHHPLFFYSRKRHNFYSLDHTLKRLNRRYQTGGGAITGELELEAPCTVMTHGRVSRNGFAVTVQGDNPIEKDLTVDLGRLESILTRADEGRFFYSPDQER